MSSHMKPKKASPKFGREKPMQQAEVIYREILENAPDGIFRATLKGKFILVNPAMASLYGYSSSSDMLATVTDLAHEIFADPNQHENFIQQLMEKGKVDKYEVCNLRKDGSVVWVCISACIVQGREEYYEGVVRDITERKQREISLLESETLYRQAIEAAGAVPYHQVFIQEAGTTKILYRYIGEGIRQLTGYGPDEFDSTLWDTLVLETHLLGELKEHTLADAIHLVRSGTNLTWKAEFKIRTREGDIRWVFDTAVELRDENDLSNGSIGLFQDITERKLTEERLREDEAIFESFMEHSPVYVFFKDRGLHTLRLSKNFEKMLGMPVSDALGKTMDELFPSDLAKSMEADDLRILKQGKRVDVVEELNGRIYETTKFPIFKDDMPTMLAGFTMDITERKKAERKLRESEERYQNFISQSFEGIYRTEFDHPIDISLPVEMQIDLIYESAYMAECNQALADMYAIPSVNALIGARLIDVHGGKDNPVNRAVFRKFIENGYRSMNDETMEYRVDGEPVWFLSNTIGTVENGLLIRLWGTALVITDRKRAEEELRLSEASLKFSQQVAHVGNWTWDTTSNKVTWSDEMYRIFGLDPATFDGDLDKIVLQAVHPDDREKVIEANNRVLTEQKPASMEYRVIWPNQSVHTVWAVPGAKVTDADGKIIKLGGIVQDITERVQAEQAQSRSEMRYRQLFNSTPVGILLADSHGHILDVNATALQILGSPSAEATRSINMLAFQPLIDAGISADFKKCLDLGDVVEGEYAYTSKWGKSIFAWVRYIPIKDREEPEPLVQFIVEDVTERKKSEDAMRAIADVGRDISSTLQLNLVLDRIASYARNLLNAETSAVYLVESATSTLKAIAAFGPDAEEIKNDPILPGEGILGNIALQKWGEIVNDTLGDPRGIEIKGTEAIPNEHLMGVPVLLKEQLTGLIAVWRVGEAQDFKSSDLDFLNSLAQQVAVAIENARLFEETQRRLREMEAVAQVGAALSQTLDLESLLEEILGTAIHAIPPAERGSILLAGEDENLHIRAVWGYSDPRVRDFSFPPDLGYSSIAFREQRPIVVPDVRSDAGIRYEGEISEMLAGGSAIAVPLIVKDNPIGVIAIDTPKLNHAFNQYDLKLLTTISASAGLAIENTRLFDETRHRLSDLEALHAVSTALRTAQTLHEALPILLSQLMKVLNVEGTALETLDRESGEIVIQLAQGAWEPIIGLRTPRNAGISGRVISTGQPYVSANVIADGLSDRPDLFGGLHCVACVPIISQHEPIGALWIGRRTRIKVEQIGLLSAIGEMVGNAIHRMLLHEQTERQVKHLDALRTIERTINSSLDLRVTLNILLEQVVAQLDADAAAILLLNPHTFVLEYTASKGLRNVNALGSLRLGESATSRVVLERSFCTFPDLSEKLHEFGRPTLIANEELLAYHAAPLIAKGQVRGVLEVFHRTPYHPETEWTAFLQSLAEQAAIAIDNAELFSNLQRSNDELTLAYDNTIAGWARALDLREKETGDHSYRVTETALKLAIALGVQDTELVHIRRGALLHDIGKVGIPDSILLKADQLSEDEWEVMRMHPVYARDLLRPISYLQAAMDIPYCHHEKWDGKGYPQGLSGEAIPLAARIFAIVDVWDALLSNRPYRLAWPRQKALEYIRSESGRYFDPRVVDMFLKIIV